MSARIISTLGRAIDVIVAGRAVSHLRFAAGVCVLAAVLLMGSAGGAVAVADRDSRGSAAPGHGGTNASRQGSTKASSPVGKVTDTRRKTVQGVTNTPGSGRQRGQQPSTGAKSPKKEPGGTDTKDEKKDGAKTRGREKRLGPRRRGSRCGGAGCRCGRRRVADAVAPGRRCGGAGCRCGGAGSRCGGAGSRCGGAGSPMRWRRLPMRWRRLPMRWRRLPMRWRRLPMRSRRLPMRSRRLPMRSRRLPMRSRRLPMRSRRLPMRSRRLPMRSRRFL